MFEYSFSQGVYLFDGFSEENGALKRYSIVCNEMPGIHLVSEFLVALANFMEGSEWAVPVFVLVSRHLYPPCGEMLLGLSKSGCTLGFLFFSCQNHLPARLHVEHS